MKNKLLPLGILILSIISMNAYNQDVTPQESEGFVSLEFDEFYFEVDANKGGKNTSFKINDKELLYMDNSEYLWGSVLWPSPQSEWGWPPSAELDFNPYEIELKQNSFVLTSEKDSKTGLVFRKTIYANTEDKSVTHLYRMINQSGKTKSNAAWEVTRVPAGGLTFFPMGDGNIFGELSELFVIDNGIVYYDHANSDEGNRKFFSDGSEGWFAHVTEDGLLFVKQFDDVPKNQQAPSEAEVELWLTGNHSYIELENQGAYTELADGDSVDYEVKWYLRELPAEISVEIGNSELIDYVRALVGVEPVQINSLTNETKTCSVYPNPAHDVLAFKGIAEGRYDLRVIDISGKTVLNKQNVHGASNISVRELNTGIYLFTLTNSDYSFKGRIEIIK